MKTEKIIADGKPELIKEWDFEKNYPLTPYNITCGSGKKVWWVCFVCNYKWSTTIASRCRSGNGCPACSNRTVTDKNNNNLTFVECLLNY